MLTTGFWNNLHQVHIRYKLDIVAKLKDLAHIYMIVHFPDDGLHLTYVLSKSNHILLHYMLLRIIWKKQFDYSSDLFTDHKSKYCDKFTMEFNTQQQS